jgi:xanthine dehydrogenase accessory factor
MKSESHEIFDFALVALQRGEKVCLVSVVATYGSSPRPIGSLLAVGSSGRFKGSVSGGCVEEDLIAQLSAAMPNKPELLSYGGTETERKRLQLPCGGQLRLLLEPMNDMALLQSLIAACAQRKTLQWQCNLKTGAQQIFVLPDADLKKQPDADLKKQPEAEATVAANKMQPALGTQYWHNYFGPQWRLYIIGAGPIARYLVEMAASLDIASWVIDPRPEYRQNWDDKLAPLIAKYPDDVFAEQALDDHCVLAALSHDPKLDDLAIISALQTPVRYIGAMGSVKTSAARRQRLSEHFDFSEASLARLTAPIGLDIASKTPAQNAISILADIIARKNNHRD